jgi:hypothetical protein
MLGETFRIMSSVSKFTPLSSIALESMMATGTERASSACGKFDPVTTTSGRRIALSSGPGGFKGVATCSGVGSFVVESCANPAEPAARKAATHSNADDARVAALFTVQPWSFV